MIQPRPTAGHIGLNVTNLDRSKAFYVSVLGFEVMNEHNRIDQRYVFLTDGQRLVLSLWEQSGGRFSPSAPGLHHVSFELESRESIQGIESRLRSLGIAVMFDGIVAHSTGSVSGGLFFEDPDGIRVEVYAHDAGRERHAPYGKAPTCGFWRANHNSNAEVSNSKGEEK